MFHSYANVYGWSEFNAYSGVLRIYWMDSCMHKCTRLVIPSVLRNDILKILNEDHQGIVKSREHAHQSV